MAGQRDQNLALRRENLLGINQFPNFGEVISQDLPGSVFEAADFRAEGAMVETLHPYRGAMAFEKLRYKTDQYAKHYSRPLAFMLTIGNPAMRKARAQFASNFFAVAGFEVMDNNGFETVEEGLVAARAAHAGIIVVCSSDEEYARLVPELNSNIGDEILVVAGNPACRPELEALGVKNIHSGSSNASVAIYRSSEINSRGIIKVILNSYCIASGLFLVIKIKIRICIKQIVRVPHKCLSPIYAMSAKSKIPFAFLNVDKCTVDRSIKEKRFVLEIIPRQIKHSIVFVNHCRISIANSGNIHHANLLTK